MTAQAKKVLESVIALSEEDRRAVLSGLMDSLFPEGPSEEEIERRIDEVESGKVKTIPFDEAMSALGRRKKNGTGKKA